MAAKAVRILTVGKSTFSTGVTLARLAECGWASYAVESVRDAHNLLRAFQIDVVLAAESLPDGRGYDLADCVARQAGTLLVGVALSENSLWLPVIDHGQRVLGSRAIGARVLETELVKILSIRARERGVEPVTPAPQPKRAAPPRNAAPKRKNASAA